MRHQRSQVFQQSLSEFGFILFFVFAAAASILAFQLYARMDELRAMVAEVSRLSQENQRIKEFNLELENKLWTLEWDYQQLEEENKALLIELDRYRLGNVPCDRRPNSFVQPISLEVIIVSANEIQVRHNQANPVTLQFAPRTASLGFRPAQGPSLPEATTENRSVALTNVMLELLIREFTFARSNSCYLRGRIINRTESFTLFDEARQVFQRLSVVVVN